MGGWSSPLACAFRDGFYQAINRQPWEDMHDWLALTSIDYSEGKSIPSALPREDLDWKSRAQALERERDALIAQARECLEPFAKVGAWLPKSAWTDRTVKAFRLVRVYLGQDSKDKEALPKSPDDRDFRRAASFLERVEGK